ncbi:MAG: DUF2723 domain-containing protein [Anaerolineae bacterium]
MKLGRMWHLVVDRDRWVWILLGAGVLAVYLLTMNPGVQGGDPGELQFVPYILGLPHPTGTPLYILLGKLWTLLPLGPGAAWRMTLLAAVSATCAVILVYQAVYATYRHPVPALAAGLSLGIGLTFWEQALLADKYAFNALMVALVLYLALRWGQTRTPRALNLLAVTYGLSLTHHRTMALFAPVLLGYVWWHERGALWRDGRRLLRLALLAIAPLLLYLYLPWASARGLPPGTWRPRTVRAWYDYLFDTGRTGMVYIDPHDLGQMLLFYARTLQRDFTWAGVLLGIGGLAWQFHRRRADAVLLLAGYLLQAFLAANHHVPRHWVYFIPSFLIYAVWVGEGVGALWQVGSGLLRRFGTGGWRWAGRALQGTAALVLLAWPWVPFPERYIPLRTAHLGAGTLDPWRQTLKTGYMGDRLGSAIAGVASNAVIVCDWEQATALWVYQQVEGLRPDVSIVYPMERLEEAASRGRPLYVARAEASLADRWYPSCSDSLIALDDNPAYDFTAERNPLSIRLGGTFELAGYSYGAPEGGRMPLGGEATFRPGAVVPLTLHWRALHAPAHDYSVSLRLYDEAREQVCQVDSQHPVLGTYPTSRWGAGQVVSDYYELQLDPELSPGTYRWGVTLYRTLPEGGWESLKVDGTEEEIAIGGAFQVSSR